MEKSTHTTEYMALRAELLAARKIADLSQRDLAGILKVPHSWVAKVESGERRIDLIEFSWFLSACGVDSLAAVERLLKTWRTPRTSRHPKEGGSK
jgi:transcriptional regulator with XRE-family HTH domain